MSDRITNNMGFGVRVDSLQSHNDSKSGDGVRVGVRFGGSLWFGFGYGVELGVAIGILSFEFGDSRVAMVSVLVFGSR